jgi:hypothetical protein
MNSRQWSIPDRVLRWMQQPMRPISVPHPRKRPNVPESAPSPERETVLPDDASLMDLTPSAVDLASQGMPRAAVWVTDVFGQWQHWQAPSMEQLIERTRRHRCPHCHGRDFRRSRPRSVEWFLCAVRVIPYRCYSCNRRFFGMALNSRLFPERVY